MNTLITSKVSSTLHRLFLEDSAISTDSSIFLSQLDEEAESRLMRSKTEYLDFYGALKNLPLAVSRETGALLYMLARASHAHSIVEFGTSFGVSTLHLASALRDNGGGCLITTEFERSKVGRAHAVLSEAGVSDLVDLREGDALQTLATGLPDNIDMLFLDGAKGLYKEVLALLEDRLRPGAMVIADDAHYNPEYQRYVRSPFNGYQSVAIADGVELSLRLA